MAVQSFRDSIAWQKAMELSTQVYTATRMFPREELFGLTSQMRRASVSVASNLAEGQGRLSRGEFRHFLGMARGSVLEVETQIELSLRLGYGDETALRLAQQRADEVRKIINAVLSSLRDRSGEDAN